MAAQERDPYREGERRRQRGHALLAALLATALPGLRRVSAVLRDHIAGRGRDHRIGRQRARGAEIGNVAAGKRTRNTGRARARHHECADAEPDLACRALHI
jgi:hypothetical protein